MNMEKDYIKLILGLAQASTYEQRSFIYLAKITELSKSYLNEIEKERSIPRQIRLFFGWKARGFLWPHGVL
jgi:hypothetical protein